MSFSRLVSRWKGLALTLVAIVATVWLGVTGQLGLYIHPRYYVFTMIMAGIAAVLVIGAFAAIPRADESDDHGHPDAHAHGSRRPHPVLAVVGALAAVLVVAGAVVTLLVVPPTALTSAAVEQRSLNGSSNTLSGVSAGTATSSGDTSSYTVKDWATLIRQGADADSLAGQTATLTGFVTPDSDDPENVFYVARFVVTCCAVDAQPVGVAVYEPGWAGSYPTDSWVTVVGSFEANPSVLSTATTVVVPSSLTAVSQPAEPYVY